MPSTIDKINRYLLINSGVPLAQKIFFTENLRVMVHAGLSMSEALNTLALQSESKTFKQMLTEIKEGVEQGRPLAQELAKFPKAFPEIFVNMVDIGEVSGTLEDTLRELTQQMKKSYKLRSKVKGAMTYPIVILVAMLGITTGLIVFVLPKLLEIFKEFGEDVKLPIATRILIAVTDFVNNNGLLVAISGITIVGSLIWFGKTKAGKNIFHMFFIRFPTIGPVVRKVQLAVFTRTLSSLLKTDIPVVQALEITSGVTGNVHYKKAILSTGELIQKGGTISQSLEGYPLLFPPLVVQMTLVGERSGNVDGLLSDIAEFYEAQVDNILDSLSSIIEPILILMLGGMVGGIALAVMTPMYSLTEHISS